MNTPSPSLLAWMPSTSEPSTRMSLGPLPITLHVNKHLPPRTAYLLCSGVCYELACDGDGLRIVRQFRWPMFPAESQPSLSRNSSES